MAEGGEGVEDASGFDGPLKHVVGEIFDDFDPCDIGIVVGEQAAIGDFPIGKGFSHGDA